MNAENCDQNVYLFNTNVRFQQTETLKLIKKLNCISFVQYLVQKTTVKSLIFKNKSIIISVVFLCGWIMSG